MLDHPTHTQLRKMKLDGMADALEELQGEDDEPSRAIFPGDNGEC